MIKPTVPPRTISDRSFCLGLFAELRTDSLGFVDLHSHVLPGLDDGAPDVPTSMSMIEALESIGFDVVCATPHQKTGQFLPPLDSIRTAHRETRDRVEQSGLSLSLSLGAENMWDATFYERCRTDAIPSYDDGPAFLVEFPLGGTLPVSVFDHLFELRSKGRLPVLAHPERYEPLWSSDELCYRLAETCAMVVDLGAVAGYHGRKRTKAARKMLKSGIAHAAASDAHTPNDVRVAAEGIEWIRKKLGGDAVTRLLDSVPRRVLAGEHPRD